MTWDLTDTLRRLVSIPSVNPMGGAPEEAEFAESRLTDYLEELFCQWGLPYQRQTVEPGRDNIVALVAPAGADARGLLLFEVHQDTVPATGMVIPPWTPRVCQGRMYGRGACDVKGGMAAMLDAVRRLAVEPPRQMPAIALACTVNEEHGFSGIQAVPRLWEAGGFLPRRPDAAIVAEPTDLQLVVAHKGVVRWRVHSQGRAAHSAHPEQGDNAIYRMARALCAIERYQQEIVGRLDADPLCGPATLSVGVIRGGVSVNTVPDRCTIEIDRRLTPAERPESARQHLIDYLAALGVDTALEHEPSFMQGVPLRNDRNRAFAAWLLQTLPEAVGPCRSVGVPYGTDAAWLATAGVPTVVFGPGSIAQAHTADEWIDLGQVQRAAAAYYVFASRFAQAAGAPRS